MASFRCSRNSPLCVLGFYEKCKEIPWSFLETMNFRCDRICCSYSKVISIWPFPLTDLCIWLCPDMEKVLTKSHFECVLIDHLIWVVPISSKWERGLIEFFPCYFHIDPLSDILLSIDEAHFGSVGTHPLWQKCGRSWSTSRSLVCCDIRPPAKGSCGGKGNGGSGWDRSKHAALCHDTGLFEIWAQSRQLKSESGRITVAGDSLQIEQPFLQMLFKIMSGVQMTKYRVSYIRCSRACHERGCAACPQREQGKATLRRLAVVKTR
jgi:hypothetical protein